MFARGENWWIITFAVENPSENRQTAQMNSTSGWAQDTARKFAFRNVDILVRLPTVGVIVINIPNLRSKLNECDPNWNIEWRLFTNGSIASSIVCIYIELWFH